MSDLSAAIIAGLFFASGACIVYALYECGKPL